jgi:hypothetical protein
MLFLYQSVGRRAQETVKSTLSYVSTRTTLTNTIETYQSAIAMPQTVLAWKQLLLVTPAQ